MSYLTFANNIVLITIHFQELQVLLKEPNEHHKEIEFIIKFKKTKIICYNQVEGKNIPVKIYDTTIEIVEECIYQRHMIHDTGLPITEITRMEKLAWSAI